MNPPFQKSWIRPWLGYAKSQDFLRMSVTVCLSSIFVGVNDIIKFNHVDAFNNRNLNADIYRMYCTQCFWDVKRNKITHAHWIGGNQKRNTIDKRRSKIFRNRVFDCHLLPNWQQMAIKYTVSSDPGLSIVKSIFDCCLSDVIWGPVIVMSIRSPQNFF